MRYLTYLLMIQILVAITACCKTTTTDGPYYEGNSYNDWVRINARDDGSFQYHGIDLEQTGMLVLSGRNRKNNARFTIEDATQIMTIPSLKRLKFDEINSFEPEAFQKLNGLDSLESLAFSGCQNIDTKVSGSISKMEHVKSLTFFDCPGISDIGLKYFAQENRLKELVLGAHPGMVSFTGEGINGLNNLESLHISSSWVKRSMINNKFCESIGGMENLTSFSLYGNYTIDDHGIANFSRLKNLKELRLHNSGIPWESTDFIDSLTQLETLKISGHSFKPSSFSKLKGLLNLKRVELDGINDDDTVWLFHCPNLEFLKLDSPEITGTTFSMGGQLTNLRDLSINCRELTGEGIDNLRHFTHITSLWIACPEEIFGESWDYDDRYPTQFDDRLLKAIRELKQLKSLELADKGIFTSEGFEYLTHLPNLEKLSCVIAHDERNVEEFSRKVQVIASISSIKKLTLRLENIQKGSDLKPISQMESLEILCIRDFGNVKDVDLIPLSNLKHLKKLKIDGADITNKIYEILPKFPSLEEVRISDKKSIFIDQLTLGGTNLTLKNIELVLKMPNLKMFAAPFPPETINELRKKYPNIAFNLDIE